VRRLKQILVVLAVLIAVGLPRTELVVRVLSVMVGLNMYVFIINISVAFRGHVSTHHDILTRRERRGCNPCVPCAGSLSLGRSAEAAQFINRQP